MKSKALAILLFGFGIACVASAGAADKGAIIGGALGGRIGEA